MPTLIEATDAVCSTINVAWLANAPALNGGTAPEVEWPNVQREGPPLYDGNVAWAKLIVDHDFSDQATLGGVGERVFERAGSFAFQVFVPAGKRGLDQAGRLAMVALNAFEGVTSPGGVRFYRVKPKTVGQRDAWYQFNVEGVFEYDVVK